MGLLIRIMYSVKADLWLIAFSYGDIIALHNDFFWIPL